MNVSPQIDKLLHEANEKLLQWRSAAYLLLFAATAFAAAAASCYLAYPAGSDGPSRITYGVLLLAPVLLLGMLARSMLGIAHAYALRAGHLEDLGLYIAWMDPNAPAKPGEWLDALVRLRREHIGQMVFQSLPDVQQSPLGEAGKAAKG